MLVEKEKVFYEEQKKQIKEEIEVIRLNTKKELKEATSKAKIKEIQIIIPLKTKASNFPGLTIKKIISV